MKAFDKEGDYVVKITSAKLKRLDKQEDPDACQILLYGETEDGYGAIGEVNWTHTVINAGKSAGMSVADKSRELLASLGVEDGSPMNLGAKIREGLVCQFAVKWDEYDGKKRLKVKWINPLNSLIDIDEVDWSGFSFAKGLPPKAPRAAVAAPAMAPFPAQAALPDTKVDEDDIPF